jgi:CRP-like cAMP-binding protein
MDKQFENNLTKFFDSYKLIRYKKGEVILRPGDNTDFVGFIKSGFVRVYTVNESGQEITMSFFKPILYFTAIYAMTGVTNKFYFEAISPVEIWKVPKEKFMEYCEKNQMICRMIMERMSLLFLDLVDHVGKLMASDSLSKVAIIISSVNQSETDFALTHKLIASLSGLTRETVTIQMLKLEKMKLIDNKNRKVTILNQVGLEKIIGR